MFQPIELGTPLALPASTSPGSPISSRKGLHEQCTHLKSIRELTNELYNLQSHAVSPNAFRIAKMYHSFATSR